MTEEQKEKVAKALWKTWEQIGDDVIQVIKDSEEDFLDEQEMFESAADAQRPVTFGYLSREEYEEFVRSSPEVHREIKDMAFKNEGGYI